MTKRYITSLSLCSVVVIALFFARAAIADPGMNVDYTAHPEKVNALTASLKNDATKTMKELLRQSRRLDALIAYLQVKIEKKEFADIADVLDKFRLGSGNEGDVCHFLGEKSADENGHKYFINQRNLGYFIGALTVAIRKASRRETKRAAIAENIVNSFLSVGTITSLSQEGSSPLCGLTRETVEKIIRKIRAKPCRWHSELYELSYPRNLKTGEVEPLAGESDFDAAATSLAGAVAHCQ